jgi:hypothetical protein
VEFIDGSRGSILAVEDTGELFWAAASRTEQGIHHLRSLFSGPLGYTYTAFRQAILLYEEFADEEEYRVICDAVASAVTIHAEFVSLLQNVEPLMPRCAYVSR